MLTEPHWTVEYFNHMMEPIQIHNEWHDGLIHHGSYIHIYPHDLAYSLEVQRTNRLAQNEGNAHLDSLGEPRVC